MKASVRILSTVLCFVCMVLNVQDSRNSHSNVPASTQHLELLLTENDPILPPPYPTPPPAEQKV